MKTTLMGKIKFLLTFILGSIYGISLAKMSQYDWINFGKGGNAEYTIPFTIVVIFTLAIVGLTVGTLINHWNE